MILSRNEMDRPSGTWICSLKVACNFDICVKYEYYLCKIRDGLVFLDYVLKTLKNIAVKRKYIVIMYIHYFLLFAKAHNSLYN